MKLQRPSFKVVMLALLGLLVVLAVGWWLSRSGPLAPVRVTAVTVQSGTLSPALFGIGLVEARRSYALGPTAPGRVLRVLADVGDTVQAGQLLAEMDPVDLASRVLAYDAALARGASAIAVAKAQVSDTGARAGVAASNASRYQDLARQSFVSAGVAQARDQEHTSAQAALQAAQANVQAAQQDLQRVQAERAALLRQRDNLRLVAVSDGVVVSRDAEPGATLVAGQAAFKLLDPSSLWVKTRFDQGRSAGLSTGLPADIVLRSRPHVVLSGRVMRVELQSDSVTEERLAQVAFDALPPGLTLGELAEVTLKLPLTQATLLLPNAAIQRQAGQTGVWMLQGDRLQWQAVQLGERGLEGQVQVLSGLQAGQRVVVYSAKALSEGSRISVVERLVPVQP